jgi:hypothetical protein
VLALLTLVNTTLLLVLFRRENRVTRARDGAWPLLAGLTATLLLVTAIDAVRFALTGTWSGLPLYQEKVAAMQYDIGARILRLRGSRVGTSSASSR